MRNGQQEIQRALKANPALLALAETLPASGETRAAEDGAALLRDVEAFYRRFLILPQGAGLVLTLWTLATHCFEVFDGFPYLALLSPEKRCGKTRTVEVLELLAANPARTVGISEAALFRIVKSKPTLILDEAEALSGKSDRAEAIRSILNAGNRQGVTVPRCTGAKFDLEFFDVYCPKVLCAIRECPDTVRDRAVMISMQRKRPDENVERFKRRRVKPDGDALKDRIARFIQTRILDIQRIFEGLNVELLSDRDAENFEPLIAVLTVADGTRLVELQRAAESLTRAKADSDCDDSLSLRLLTDMRVLWLETEPKIFTRDLLERLKGVEDSPWAQEVELNARKLGRMLGRYRIQAATVRIGEETLKGYSRADVGPVFAAYLPPETSHPSQGA